MHWILDHDSKTAAADIERPRRNFAVSASSRDRQDHAFAGLPPSPSQIPPLRHGPSIASCALDKGPSFSQVGQTPQLDGFRVVCDRARALASSLPSKMSFSDLADLKRKLRDAGFEVYRSTPEQVLLAERIRDNLIMDSGVAAQLAHGSEPLRVHVTVRAQASHFPGLHEDGVREHAQKLASIFVAAGYAAGESTAAPVPDPNDPEGSLDTAHEIRLTLEVDSKERLFEELEAALARVRFTNDE